MSCATLVSRARRALSLVACAALCVTAAACASGGGSSGGELERPEARPVRQGDAVSGEVFVSWRNLDPRNPAVTQTIVNESSELGRALASGRKNSADVRVLGDADMGTLLAQLEDIGFFRYATEGMGLDNAPDVPGRRGIVVVERDGRTWGLMLTPGAGRTPIPAAYRDAKGVILVAHSSLPGMDVKVNVDADRVFSAPPIGLKRR